MSNGPAVAAVLAALFAALATVWSAVQARRTNNTEVDIRIYQELREEVLESKAQIRALELTVDDERRRRREMEKQLHAINRALFEANIDIPPAVAALMRPPGNTNPS